jgi:hypothetical protein
VPRIKLSSGFCHCGWSFTQAPLSQCSGLDALCALASTALDLASQWSGPLAKRVHSPRYVKRSSSRPGLNATPSLPNRLAIELSVLGLDDRFCLDLVRFPSEIDAAAVAEYELRCGRHLPPRQPAECAIVTLSTCGISRRAYLSLCRFATGASARCC